MKEDKTGTTAYNRPHQMMIQYSGKGYDEYRADLIRRLTEKGFALKEDDFLTVFIDLAAYLGEVLMTYQNAYAQEIFLETAQLRESLFSLASLVDYRVKPGSAATGTLVVMAKPDKNGLLPKGTLVSGKEEGAKEAVFFETDADLQVDARFNDFTLAQSERFEDRIIFLNQENSNSLTINEKIIVKPGQYIYFKSNRSKLPSSQLQNSYIFAQIQSSTINEEEETTTVSLNITYSETKPPEEKIKVGSGTWGLINDEPCGLLKLENTNVWLDNKYENIEKGSPIIIFLNSAIYYGEVQSLTFGTLKIKTGVSTRIAEKDSDEAEQGENEKKISQYTIPAAVETRISQDNVNLEEDEESVHEFTLDSSDSTIYFVIQKPIKKTYYIIETTHVETREVCNLTVSWLNNPPSNYNSNAQIIETSSEHIIYVGIQLALTEKVITEKYNKKKLKENENGSKLILDYDVSDLEKYRSLILHEEINGTNTKEEVKVLSTENNKIKLINSVKNDFTRHGVRIWGNIVKVTQGKTLSNTILGSGRGDEAYQSFELPKSPLTHDSRSGQGTKAAIQIFINGLLWHQKESFLNSPADSNHYVIETGFDSKSLVVFGDGKNGSRLPTGRDNVIANFKVGQGASGNVSAGVLEKAVPKPPFLEALFNPYPAIGGTEPDTEEELRKKIPVQHLTFDRAVSLQDYADLALAYPGISKAKAGWRWFKNNKHIVFLAVAIKAEPLDEEAPSNLLKDLRDYLDARRDINQPLIIRRVNRVGIKLFIEVIALSGYDTEKVRDAIASTLGSGTHDDGTPQFFNFDRLEIGMSIHKKDIYKIVENIPGVDRVINLELTRVVPGSGENGSKDITPSFCAGDVWINNWELARLEKIEDIKVDQSPIHKQCKPGGAFS